MDTGIEKKNTYDRMFSETGLAKNDTLILAL